MTSTLPTGEAARPGPLRRPGPGRALLAPWDARRLPRIEPTPERKAHVAELRGILARQLHDAPGIDSWLDLELAVGEGLAFMLVNEQVLARARRARRPSA